MIKSTGIRIVLVCYLLMFAMAFAQSADNVHGLDLEKANEAFELRITPKTAFGVDLQFPDDGTRFTYLYVIDTKAGKAAAFIVLPNQNAVQWGERRIRKSEKGVQVLGEDGKVSGEIRVRNGFLYAGGKKTNLRSLAGSKALNQVSVSGKFPDGLLEQCRIADTGRGLVPPYNGCCSDCCYVHEWLGTPDWTDWWCCWNYCGGSGSCG